MSRPVTRRRRVAAIVSLIAVGCAVMAVAGALWGAWLPVVHGFVGLWVALAGTWWVVTERVPRRAVGAAAVATGLGLVWLALVRRFDGAGGISVRLVVVGAMVALAGGSARVALVRDLPRIAVHRARAVRPGRPVLLCNLESGGGKVEQFRLLELAAELDVEAIVRRDGDDLARLALDAVARGADCLGVAGGDGSQAVVAQVAVEHDLPFVCVSAGTRNHFALDLGLNRDDPRETMRAFHDAVERRVDYATVGDRLFVNNVSLGAYAKIVQEDGYRDAKADTALAKLPVLLGRGAEAFDLQFTTPGGDQIDGAFLIHVSNNPYVLDVAFDLSQRRRLDRGQLGIVAVSTATAGEAARLLALAAVGQRHRFAGWHEWTAREFEVRSRSGSVFAAVDGEATELPTPLQLRIHPRGLRLLVPDGNVEEAWRRQGRDIDLGALVDVAAGRPPAPRRPRPGSGQEPGPRRGAREAH